MSERDKDALDSEITRAIDNSPCEYEQVISVLKAQLKFMLKAREQEHPQLVSRAQLLKDLKTLSNLGKL